MYTSSDLTSKSFLNVSSEISYPSGIRLSSGASWSNHCFHPDSFRRTYSERVIISIANETHPMVQHVKTNPGHYGTWRGFHYCISKFKCFPSVLNCLEKKRPLKALHPKTRSKRVQGISWACVDNFFSFIQRSANTHAFSTYIVLHSLTSGLFSQFIIFATDGH